MAELRWHPLIKDWIMIASHRQARPQMPKAVSYTHLDVYKRQTLNCITSSMGTMKGMWLCAMWQGLFRGT